MIDVRQGERGRALLAFAILFLVLGAYTAVKTVRDAVFLSRFGVTEISFVAIGLAVASGVVVTVFLRATAGIARHWLITLTHGIIALSLLGLWAALGPDAAGWVPWALYIWSSLFGVFIVMQFWLLAADLFDVREAKRLFGLVGAGAILGALGGGLIAQQVATRFSAELLLVIAAAMLVVAAALAHLVWPLRPREEEKPKRREESDEEDAPGIVSLLTTPSLLRLIALSLLLSTVATTLIDWQVKAIAKQAFDSRADDMASFFGTLFAFQSVAALVVQVLLTGWILRRLGLAAGRLVLPLSVIAGSLAIVLHPMLAISIIGAAGFAKVAEGGLRFAVDKAATELTWLPVPSRTRNATKSFIDTVFDRLGTGLTGITWLTLAAIGLDAPDRIHLMSIVVIGLTGLWMLVLKALHTRYVDAFRKSIASRSIDLVSLRAALGAEEAARRVSETLGAEDADQALFGLYLLEDGDAELPDMSPALSHASADVRRRTLTLLERRQTPGYTDQAEALLEDDDHSVREAAILYLQRLSADTVRTASFDESVSFSEAVMALSSPTQAEDAQRHIERALEAEDGERLSNIQLLGAAPAPIAARLLRKLIEHDDDAIRTAAIRAAGRASAVDLVPRIAERLRERHWRATATSALAEMGPDATMELVAQLDEKDLPIPAQTAIIRLAGASGHAPVATRLEPLLSGPSDLAMAAARALGRLRVGLGDEVRIDVKLVQDRVAEVARTLYRRLIYLGRGSWPLARESDRGDKEPLLDRAVREAADAHVRHMFALLTLIHDPDDVRSSFRGVSSPLKAVRARSLEFLENLLTGALRELVVPPLEELDPRRLRAAARTVGVQRARRDDAMIQMLEGDDPWLRAVTCWEIGRRGMNKARDAIAPLIHNTEDPDLKAIAIQALHQIDRTDADVSSETEPLTQVEKALKLRAVDVLKQAASEDLAYVAQLASEVTLEEGEVVYREHDAPDALYVVIEGEVELTQGDVDIGVAEPGEAFGSWALVDDAPRVASAKARGAARLLKVGREDFTDLLADRPDIVQAVFKAMVERIRNLAALAQGDGDD